MKLRTKISLSILPLICLCFLVLARWTTHKAGAQLRESQYAHLETVVSFFYQEQLEKAQELLEKNQLTSVQSFVKAYQRTAIDNIADRYVVSNGQFLIVNNREEIIYGSGPYVDEMLLQRTYLPLISTLAKEQQSVTRGHLEQSGIHDIFVARYFAPWGWTVFLIKNDREIHNALQSISYAAFGAAITCACVCYLLMSYFFEKFISRPIKLLTDAAKDISRRTFVESIPVYTSDELGLLARSIESTSADIAEYQKYQAFWQEKLEIEVEKRTEALQKELIVRLKAQEALQKSEELLNDVGLIALIGGWEIDFTSGDTTWTRQTFEILERNVKDAPIEYSQFLELFMPNYREKIASALDELKTNDVHYDIEAECITGGGSHKWCRLVFRGVRMRFSCVKIRGTIQDITALKGIQDEQSRLQSKLLHAQKLEAIGQLASGIAHEINTPTQFVSSNIDFLKSSFKDIQDIVGKFLTLPAGGEKSGADLRAETKSLQKNVEEMDWEFLCSEIPAAIQQSQDGLKRVATIVLAMKEFSHPGSKEKSETDLNFIIQNTMAVARNEWKYVAEVDLNLAADLPLLYGHSNEIGQVILNLIVNAAQAIAEKFGKNPECKKGVISITTLVDGKWIVLTIGDNGVGISQEIRDKIFIPFFTTKEVGMGSGQGLAIAYDVIVNKHCGEINVESQPESGSIFTIRFPGD